MRVIFYILLDDPINIRTRTFIKEETAWPFPCLPVPGDAVMIDVPGGWKRISGEGDTLLSQWVHPMHPRKLQARRVKEVVYDPGENTAYILFPVTGLDDPQPQIDVLIEAGFRELS